MHSCADAAHVAMFAGLLSKTPYSLSLHGPLDDYGPNQREKWHRASFALVITKQLNDEIHRRLAGFLPDRIALAAMGVELQKFERTVSYAAWSGSGPLRLFS